MRVDLEGAALVFEKMAHDLAVEVRQAEAMHGNEAVLEADRLSFAGSPGPFTSRLLSQLGHPYAQTGSHTPPLASFFVNNQGGALSRSWYTRPPQWTAGRDGFSSIVASRDPKSGYLRGTRYMIPRPILEQVAINLYARRRALLEQAILRSYPV